MKTPSVLQVNQFSSLNFKVTRDPFASRMGVSFHLPLISNNLFRRFIKPWWIFHIAATVSFVKCKKKILSLVSLSRRKSLLLIWIYKAFILSKTTFSFCLFQISSKYNFLSLTTILNYFSHLCNLLPLGWASYSLSILFIVICSVPSRVPGSQYALNKDFLMSYFINKGIDTCFPKHFINLLGEGGSILLFKDLCSFHWEAPTTIFSVTLLGLVMFITIPFYIFRNQ